MLERFPEDLLGDGGTRTDAASILARFEIISNFDVTPPLISASLVEDTGSSDNDFLTNNPTISGTVEDISLITEFKAGFDDALEADFVDVLGQLQEDGSFNFDAAIIQEINNNTELSQGEHTLKLTATDVVGNKAETFEFTFILDSENPDLIINTPVDDGFINGRSNLTGNLEGTGSGLASLSYRFDQGELIEVTVDENGNFDQRFDVTGLSFDEHSLTLIATDEAGNITEETVNVTVQELTSLRVTGTTPLDGATEIGSTFRPQVFFSEPIDTSTLNENNFYASFAGQKLAANIVPGEDGTFAWLFFEETMPNASLIQVTVDGSTITNLEGSSLDADGDGIAGGIQTFSFTTVSLEPIPNTTITGFVLDPGPDKLPFTEDDFDAGADGIEGTEDDIFLLPIAGAEVFILGLEEEEKVITDEQGRFTLTEVPVGNVKVEVQGMTATNAPEGFYFPEMVMDVNIEPGVENFIMGMEHIYLPRIDNEILNTVTASETTMIMAGEAGAPELSEEERNSLTLEIQPQSLVGEDGEKLDNAEIGIRVC